MPTQRSIYSCCDIVFTIHIHSVGARGQVDRVLDSRLEGVLFPVLVMCRNVRQLRISHYRLLSRP